MRGRREGPKIWEGFPGEVEEAASFPLPHQTFGFPTFQSLEATPRPKNHPKGSWLHSAGFQIKSGAYKVTNRWRFCLHKIEERGREKSPGEGEGGGKHGRGRKRKTERKRKPKPVPWLGKVTFQIQTVGVSGWEILK